MKSLALCIKIALLWLVLYCCAIAGEIRLADNGKTDYIITLPENAAPVQRTAASELAKYLNEITGAEFPIRVECPETISPDVKQLAIGPSKTTDTLLLAAGLEGERENCDYDNVRIAQCGESVVLTGHNVRGMLYAVYTFLENDLRCRWWTTTESTIPRDISPVFEVTSVDYAPKLRSRELYYTGLIGPANGEFAVKMKCNGHFCAIPEEFGGHLAFEYFVHTFYHLIPPQKYFLDHPDWFPEIDGIRKVEFPAWSAGSDGFEECKKQIKPEQIHSSGTQLCLTNEGLFQEMLKNALQLLKDNPEAKIISISQNDWHGYCTCEKCRAIDEEEGSHAGTLLRFVNRLAEEIEKVYPDIYVDTLAYQYTRKPPKITHARHNVIVRLCTFECSFIQPLTGEQNTSLAEDMALWREKAQNIFVWDYVTDFTNYMLPYPNYRIWKDNINFLVDHNTVGLFEQGDSYLKTGDFVQLRSWVMAKLLWDPSLDQRALMEEFIAGYYAPELVPIYMEYFDTLSDACEKSGIYLDIYRENVYDWLDLDSINKATKLSDQALEIARHLATENPEQYKDLPAKVLRERIPLDLVWALNPMRYRLEALILGKEYAGPENPLQAAEDMFARYEDSYGPLLHNEGVTLEWYEQFKDQIYAGCDLYDAAPVPDFLADVPSDKRFELADNMYNFYQRGSSVFIEKDAAASNGVAVRMPGSLRVWAITFSSSNLFQQLKKVNGTTPQVHLYLYARADCESEEGMGLEVGVYDSVKKDNVFYKEIPLSEMKGEEYKLIDLGTFEPGECSDFWSSALGRDDVKNIWVDRVFFVWE